MVARIEAPVVAFHGLGEEVGAPVCYAADYAAVGEDECAGCADEAVGVLEG